MRAPRRGEGSGIWVLSVYDKRVSLSDLAGADIVLTTYGVVVAEHGGAQARHTKPEARSPLGVSGE